MKNAVHQYEDKLLEFAYGELPQHEADAVDAHVRGCARCSQALTEIRSVRTAMSTLPMEAAPDAGLDSLMAFAEQAAKRNAQTAAPVPFWKKYLTPLVAVMTVVTVGVFGFRASEELDVSPQAASADRTFSETKEKKKREEYAAKVDVQQAPAPVAAAQPEPPPLEELEQDFSNTAKVGFEGKRAAAKELQKPAPTSETRRQYQGNVYDGDGVKDVKQQNFSDVGLRGTTQARRELEAPKAEPTRQAPSPPPPPTKTADKGGLAFGLGGGGLGTAPTESPVEDELARKDANKIVTKSPAPSGPSAAPAATGGSGSIGGLTDASTARPGVSKKKSLSMSDYRGRVANDDEVRLEEKADALGVDRDLKNAENQRAALRVRSLESARLASNRGDRSAEIRFAAEALGDGATGSERVEALKRLCDAWESLGEPARADPYCDALLREFPGTLAAKNVSDRRNSMQRPATPARAEKKGKSYEFSDEAEKKPAATPADAAQSY